MNPFTRFCFPHFRHSLTHFPKLKGGVELVSGGQQEDGVVDPRVQRRLRLKAPFKPDSGRQKKGDQETRRLPGKASAQKSLRQPIPTHTHTHTMLHAGNTNQSYIALGPQDGGLKSPHETTIFVSLMSRFDEQRTQTLSKASARRWASVSQTRSDQGPLNP